MWSLVKFKRAFLKHIEKKNVLFFLLLFSSLAIGVDSLPVASSPPENPNGCVELVSSLTETEKLKKEYQKNYSYRYWNSWKDSNTTYLRFISKQSFEEMKDTVHPVDMYGEKNFLAWRRAAEELDNIPLGKLKLSIDLFAKVHKVASSELFPVMKFLKRIIPAGYLPTEGGVLKKRPSFGVEPLSKPLTEEQYQAIKNNPWLHGFWEVPGRSKPGARVGLIQYATGKETKPKLEKLIQWYNDNKNTMDPIELAARFQQAYVSIHPFIDGNGRTSRLLMDRILAEHGLPPPILDSQNEDIYLNPEAYVEHIRDGVKRYLEINQSGTTDGAVPVISKRYSADIVGLGVRYANHARSFSKLHPQMSLPGTLGTNIIDLGGVPFVLLQDGFFYSHRGIPYVFHDGKLYPIADSSYEFYFPRMQNHKEKTKLSRSQTEVYRSHFGLLKKIREGTLNPTEIEIAPYSQIENANNRHELFLYDWQKPVFEEAIVIRPTDPKSILSNSRIPQTSFDQAVPWDNPQPALGQVIAQYEQTDFRFWKYEQYAKKHLPRAVSEIRKSREKLWRAGRELIKDFLAERQSLSPADHEKLKEYPAYNAWNSYFIESKLAFSDFEGAMERLGDDKITLLRADDSHAGIIGIRSQSDYKKLFQSLPKYSAIKRYFKEWQTYLEKPENRKEIEQHLKVWQGRIDDYQPFLKILPRTLRGMTRDLNLTLDKFQRLLKLLNARVFGSRYESRGTAPEFERALVDYLLHAGGGTPNKVGSSYTTNLNLLITGANSEALPFTSGAVSASLFLVKVPKEKIEWNFASNFTNEYEMIGKKPVYPWEIKKIYPGYLLAKGTPPELSDRAGEFLTKYGIGSRSSEEKARKLKEITSVYEKAASDYQKTINDPLATAEQKAEALTAYQKAMETYQKENALLNAMK